MEYEGAICDALVSSIMSELMKDNICHWIARHLPRRLVYWCAITVNAEASTGAYGHEEVPKITMMDALDRWAGDKCEHGRLTKDYCQPCGRIHNA